MKGTHFLWISSAHAVVFMGMLGFLHIFKFISWNPLNWTKTLHIFPLSQDLVKWFLTFIIIFLAINIVTGLFLLVKKMPAIATSIVLGFVVWLLLEWCIYQDFTHIKWSSVPILTAILIVCRALAETIHYYEREVYDDHR